MAGRARPSMPARLGDLPDIALVLEGEAEAAVMVDAEAVNCLAWPPSCLMPHCSLQQRKPRKVPKLWNF